MKQLSNNTSWCQMIIKQDKVIKLCYESFCSMYLSYFHHKQKKNLSKMEIYLKE
jgi:hypothetical protein